MTAMHSERGRIDATAADLGCGWAWTAIHRVRPRVLLACPECGHGVRAKKSHLGLRFFAHDPGAPTCGLAGESMEHRLLKLELAAAVRDAGWHAALEVPGPGGHWRADVLAVSPDGMLRMAWEAQLSSITEDEIRERTERFAADDVMVCWVATQPRRWRGCVPSILLTPPREAQSSTWEVIQGLARFATEACLHHPPCPGGHGQWVTVNASLREAVAWILERRVVLHRFPAPQMLSEHWWQQTWTAPKYVSLAGDFAKAQRRARRKRAVSGTVQITSLNGRDAAGVAREVAHFMTGVWPSGGGSLARSGRLGQQRVPLDAVPTQVIGDDADRDQIHAAAKTWVADETGRTPTVYPNAGVAGGTPVYVDGAVYGVICPDPDQLDWQRWPGRRNWVMFTTSREALKRIAQSAPNGVRIVVLEGEAGQYSG